MVLNLWGEGSCREGGREGGGGGGEVMVCGTDLVTRSEYVVTNTLHEHT